MDNFKLPLLYRLFVSLFYSKEEKEALRKRLSLIHITPDEQENMLEKVHEQAATKDPESVMKYLIIILSNLHVDQPAVQAALVYTLVIVEGYGIM